MGADHVLAQPAAAFAALQATDRDPYQIDVTRPNTGHLAFGRGGPYVCLGKALARLEVRLMFEELLPRLDSVELAGDVTRVRSNFVNGIRTLLVKIRTR